MQLIYRASCLCLLPVKVLTKTEQCGALNTSCCCWAPLPICFQRPASPTPSRRRKAPGTATPRWGLCAHPIHELLVQPPAAAAGPAQGRAGSKQCRCFSPNPASRWCLCAEVLFSEKAAKSQSSESVDRVAPQIKEGETAPSRIRMQRRLALKGHPRSAKAALPMSNTAFSWKIFLLLHPFGSPCVLHREPSPYGTAGLRSRALRGFMKRLLSMLPHSPVNATPTARRVHGRPRAS